MFSNWFCIKNINFWWLKNFWIREIVYLLSVLRPKSYFLLQSILLFKSLIVLSLLCLFISLIPEEISLFNFWIERSLFWLSFFNNFNSLFVQFKSSFTNFSSCVFSQNLAEHFSNFYLNLESRVFHNYFIFD